MPNNPCIQKFCRICQEGGCCNQTRAWLDEERELFDHDDPPYLFPPRSQVSPTPVRRPLAGGATGHFLGDELDPCFYDR